MAVGAGTTRAIATDFTPITLASTGSTSAPLPACVVENGPITASCPASFLRTHADAMLTIADYVAAKPDIRLR